MDEPRQNGGLAGGLLPQENHLDLAFDLREGGLGFLLVHFLNAILTGFSRIKYQALNPCSRTNLTQATLQASHSSTNPLFTHSSAPQLTNRRGDDERVGLLKVSLKRKEACITD